MSTGVDKVAQKGDTEGALPQHRCCPHRGLNRHHPTNLGPVLPGVFFPREVIICTPAMGLEQDY